MCPDDLRDRGVHVYCPLVLTNSCCLSLQSLVAGHLEPSSARADVCVSVQPRHRVTDFAITVCPYSKALGNGGVGTCWASEEGENLQTASC